ncbi:hypothetical protein D9M69_466540 [compost metagenome]
MAKDLVEDVRFLQIVQLFRSADEGGYRELLAGQQFEEGLEGDQCRDAGNTPAGGGLEHLVDFAQLRNAVMGQVELLDTVEIFLARAAFDHLQLAGDQGVPHLMLGFGIVDETVGVGFTGHVLRRFHSAS